MPLNVFSPCNSVVEAIKANGYDLNKVIQAVQSSLNAGSLLKASASTKQAIRSVKENGHNILCLDVTTKAGERLRYNLADIGVKFYGWTETRRDSWLLCGDSMPILPLDVFGKWLDKFAKIETQQS